MGPTWGLSVPDGPMLAPWTLLLWIQVPCMTHYECLSHISLNFAMNTELYQLVLETFILPEPFWKHQRSLCILFPNKCFGIFHRIFPLKQKYFINTNIDLLSHCTRWLIGTKLIGHQLYHTKYIWMHFCRNSLASTSDKIYRKDHDVSLTFVT